MADLFGRAYRVAKAALDSARDRVEGIDDRAQEELTRSLIPGGIPDPPPASSNDPMERARAKIASAQQTATSRRELSRDAITPVSVPMTPPDPMQTAYKIIGVPPGSDFATVQQAVNKLRERCDPARFPQGSEEQSTAQVILQRVEEAFQVLSNTLAPTAGRFDRLEI